MSDIRIPEQSIVFARVLPNRWEIQRARYRARLGLGFVTPSRESHERIEFE